jgi:hypothetical protein
MSDKKTEFGQYLGGYKDGRTREDVTLTPDQLDDRTKAIKPAPKVK